MSSAAIYRVLSTDPALRQLGLAEGSVLPDFTGEVIPRDSLCIVLRWGPQQYRGAAATGPTVLTVWVHQPVEMGTDYTLINQVHSRVRRILTDMVQVVGTDNVRVTSVEFDGLGGAHKDDGFNTITKNAGYRVLLNSVW